ncbi:UDP-2,4-diacetamido-2,4,6-trideoxy-beta-L-altropyranose hydrolase [Vampirovibrio sp.]|uniref:UDP-2,4-diacetamido-2,4, 6-trideoxy-beta-L-altropyranose hydrolase n=1 Tax=Vampirovibrio sp. TaxID=2717857 RepID=UPI0035932071
MSDSSISILFRADASVETGTGHIVRCVTLAKQLQAQGAVVTFASRDLPGNLNHWLAQQGFSVISWQAESPVTIPENLAAYLSQVKPRWLVVDHYGLDRQWEDGLRADVGKMLVIDDLANRPHAGDALLDQNYFAQPQTRYAGLIPAHCQQWLGPAYALLRQEFSIQRKALLEFGKRENRDLKTLLVFFGGSDPTGETVLALQALSEMALSGLTIEVIVGTSNPRRTAVQQLCDTLPNARYYCQTDRMAELMAEADLGIVAGGSATWERLCVGLPALVIAVAENQQAISQQVAKAGAHLYLGRSGQVSKAQIQEGITRFLKHPADLMPFSEKAFQLVDGLGASRVAALMMGEI